MSSKTKAVPVMVYAPPRLADAIRQVADEDSRSVSNMIVMWCKERPEVQALLNGRTEK